MKKFISAKNESIRLFENPILEYFSHIHPSIPLIVYFPVVILSLYFGIQDKVLVYVIFSFLGGVLLWTLLEYLIHRFVFHYHPKTERGKRINFLIHGVHHGYPMDRTRLVMPLAVSVPLAIILFFLFKLIFGEYYLSYYAGLVFGYLCYDYIHYATHHFPMKRGIGKFLKVYHLKHHFRNENKSFGVSSPLWDYVFRTTPDE